MIPPQRKTSRSSSNHFLVFRSANVISSHILECLGQSPHQRHPPITDPYYTTPVIYLMVAAVLRKSLLHDSLLLRHVVLCSTQVQSHKFKVAQSEPSEGENIRSARLWSETYGQGRSTPRRIPGCP